MAPVKGIQGVGKQGLGDLMGRKVKICQQIHGRKLLWKKAKGRVSATTSDVNNAWKSVAAQVGISVIEAKKLYVKVRKSLSRKINDILRRNPNLQTFAEVFGVVNHESRNRKFPLLWSEARWLAEEMTEESLKKIRLPCNPPPESEDYRSDDERAESEGTVQVETVDTIEAETPGSVRSEAFIEVDRVGREETVEMDPAPHAHVAELDEVVTGRAMRSNTKLTKKKKEEPAFIINSSSMATVPGQLNVTSAVMTSLEAVKREEDDEIIHLQSEFATRGPPTMSTNALPLAGSFGAMGVEFTPGQHQQQDNAYQNYIQGYANLEFDADTIWRNEIMLNYMKLLLPVGPDLAEVVCQLVSELVINQ